MSKRIRIRLALLLISFGFVVSGYCQTYFVSTGVGGSCQLAMNDQTGDNPGIGTNVSFGTLNETLYYDPVNDTLRQVGPSP